MDCLVSHWRSFSVCVRASTFSSLQMTTGVPRGSILGPMLCTVFVAPVDRLISSYGVHCHECADDTQLFTKMSVPATTAIGLLHECVEGLQYWFWNSGLLLDPGKSPMAYLGTRNRLRNSTLPSQITRAGCTVDVSECVYWVVCIQCKSVQHTFIGPSCKQCC